MSGMVNYSSNVAGGHFCIQCCLDQSEDRQTDRQTDRRDNAHLKDVNGGLVDGAHYCTTCIDRVTHCPHDDSSSPGIQPCTISAHVNQSTNQLIQGLGLNWQVWVVMCVVRMTKAACHHARY